jgi:predicted nucleic acid binding AN1-type Zn finger protein
MSSSNLLSAGTVCSHDSCRTIDFLPFKCSHCTQSYCQEHWKPADHECKNYDPALEDRIVPQCQLCSLPVLVRPGQDPNVVMELHINTDCQVATGKKKRGPHCGNRKCGKSLISPIICDVSENNQFLDIYILTACRRLAKGNSAPRIAFPQLTHVEQPLIQPPHRHLPSVSLCRRLPDWRH